VPYKINEHEMQAVSSLNAPRRYEHFLKRIADWEEVWTLKSDDGFIGLGDEEGNKGIPFWPHPRHAEQYAAQLPTRYQATLIGLSDFINKWLSGMEKDGMKVFVFPVPDMQGLVVEPERVRADLSEELKLYE
jgi:hypothetical protein